MFKLIKVDGDSMSPKLNSGDYVLIWSFPVRMRWIRKGQVIVFKSASGERLIKMVTAVFDAGKVFQVRGIHPLSIGKEKIGPVYSDNILGVVIAHFRRRLSL
jgi:signal peptidase I